MYRAKCAETVLVKLKEPVLQGALHVKPRNKSISTIYFIYFSVHVCFCSSVFKIDEN